MIRPEEKQNRKAPARRAGGIAAVLLGAIVVAGEPAPCAGASGPVAADHAIAIIEGLEQKIQITQWKVRSLFGELSDPASADSIVKTRPDYVEGTILFDPVAGRFRGEFDQVDQWVQGAAPYIASREAFSFDGKAYRSWDRQKHGRVLPTRKDDAGRGFIASDETQVRGGHGFVGEWAGRIGLGFMPPYFWDLDSPPQPLSHLLRAKQAAGSLESIVEGDDGVWTIKFSGNHRGSTLRSTVHLRYDPGKGGAVLGARWMVHDKDGESLGLRLEVKNQKSSEDLWVPAQIDLVYPMAQPPFVHRVTCSEVKINPPVGDKAFRLEFPIGVYVNDHIEKKSYTVGNGIVNEQAAIRRFIESHELTRQRLAGVPAPARTRSLILVAGNVVFVLVVAGFWLLRRHRHGVAAAGLLALGVLNLAGDPATAADDAIRLAPSGDWVVSHGDGEQIYVSQCGYTVTVFALEHFGLTYSPQRVSAGLRPSRDGVRMSDLADMLRAHGLEAEARRDVTVRGLSGALRGDNLAIFPLPVTGGENHYFVAMLDKGGRPVLVNVLYGVGPLSRGLADAELKKTEGLVLFVRRPAGNDPPMSGRIRLSPPRLDLGKFLISGPEASDPLPAVLSIENPTSSPIMVVDVVRSCGCTESDWTGGVLEPGQSRRIGFTVHRGAWGEGRKTKQLIIRFADGSERRTDIVGEGMTPEAAQRLHASPRSVTLDVTDALARGEAWALAEVAVSAPGDSNATITAAGSSRWLRPELVRSGPDSMRLRIHVALDERAGGELSGGASTVTGEVLLTRPGAGQPVVVPVTLVRRPFFRFVRQVVSVTRGSGRPLPVPIEPTAEGKGPLRVLRVWSETPRLRIESRKEGDGTATVLLSAEASSAPGFEVVRCEAESPRDGRAVAKLIVKVE